MTGPRNPDHPYRNYGTRQGGQPQTLLPDLVCRLAGQIYNTSGVGMREAIRRARAQYGVPDDPWMFGGRTRDGRYPV